MNTTKDRLLGSGHAGAHLEILQHVKYLNLVFDINMKIGSDFVYLYQEKVSVIYPSPLGSGP